MFLFFFECGQPRTWRPGHALDYGRVTVDQEHEWGESGEVVRNEGGSPRRAPQSPLLKTINLHNIITFSLAVRGSCGLGLPRRGRGRHDTQSIKSLAYYTANSKRQIQVENFLKCSTPKNNSWLCVALKRTHVDLSVSFRSSFFSKTSPSARERRADREKEK